MKRRPHLDSEMQRGKGRGGAGGDGLTSGVGILNCTSLQQTTCGILLQGSANSYGNSQMYLCARFGAFIN